jgi:hypothetical protein
VWSAIWKRKKDKNVGGNCCTCNRYATINRRAKTVEAIYHLGGGTYKRKGLLLRNIHPWKEPIPTPSPTVAEGTVPATPSPVTMEIRTPLLEEQATIPLNIINPETTTIIPVPSPLDNISPTAEIISPTEAPVLETPPPTRQMNQQQQVVANGGPTPVVTVHEQAWFSDRNASLRDINGTYHRRH